MKHFTFALFFFLPLVSISQINENEFDPKKWEPPYSLDTPSGWGVERFLIPISFAPGISYKGVEDIRFTPGWGKAGSADYWSYAFLWYLDGREKINSNSIENDLKKYYTGLVESMMVSSSGNKSSTVKTIFRKGKTQKGDVSTFYGSIYMLDYMAKKPILLYCKVHLKYCTGQNKTFIFYEISPKDYSDSVWQSLGLLWTGLRCSREGSS